MWRRPRACLPIHHSYIVPYRHRHKGSKPVATLIKNAYWHACSQGAAPEAATLSSLPPPPHPPHIRTRGSRTGELGRPDQASLRCPPATPRIGTRNERTRAPGPGVATALPP